jgi:hypothetical protein
MRRHEWIGLLLVVILAAGIRFYRVDAVEFYHDEAMLGMLAQEMAGGQTFPLQGIVSSVGIPNPPQTVYTILPPFWFSNDPVFLTSWVIVLNLIGVALLYVVTLRQFGVAPALFAATFYAVNPWAVMYSRKLWAQDYVNPFLLLALLFAQLGFRDGKRWAQLLTVPIMLWGMQIHFAAWALIPLFGWIILAGRKNWHIRSLIFSAILSVMVLTPFILGIIQTLGQDPTRIGDSLSASAGRDLDGGGSPWVHWLRLLTGEGIETWLLPSNGGVLFIAAPWIAVFLIPLFLTAVWTLFRHYGWGMWGAFALWLILPTVAFDIALSDVWPHYLIPLLPGFAILLGLSLNLIPKFLLHREKELIPRNRLSLTLWRAGWGLRFFVILALSLMVYSWVTHLNRAVMTESLIGAGTSGYTTPAFVLNRVVDSLPRETNDVIILTKDMDIWFDSEAARWPVMLRDFASCVRALPVDGYAVFPNHLFTMITTPDAGAHLTTLYTDAVQTLTIENRTNAKPYITSIFEVAPAWVRAPMTDLTAPVRFDNDVLLMGYGFAGGEVYLHWSLPDAPDRRFYESRVHNVQFFVHFLDVDGNRVGQLDQQFWHARNWCAGDALYTWGNLVNTDLTAVAMIRIGFYRLGLGKEAGQTFPLDVLDSMGNPAGNWADIPVLNP